jgi:predicted Zn-dependent peptidase
VETRHYPDVDETVVTETLPNGLRVHVLPKAGCSKTYAVFGTRYGSIDNRFEVNGEEIRVPDGIAHFLEHKMFEEPDGDVFAKFAKLGASANAFTSFDRTVYLFSAAEHISENLTTLLDFVQHPWFTDENVEKEKGIIEQEINMYRDNPDWQVYFGLIAALYRRHPVRIDIAGTAESIRRIDKETLYRCHETFYHPSNMMLVVAGGADPEDVIRLVRDNQAKKSFKPAPAVGRLFEEEPPEVAAPRVERELAVSLPKCMIGFKETDLVRDAEALMRREAATRLVFEALFGPGSGLYQSLYDDQLISDSFGSEYNITPEYAFSVIGGETRDPDELVARIGEAIERAKEDGIDPARFERAKRRRIGALLRMLDRPESAANEYLRWRMRDGDLFRLPEVYREIDLAEAVGRLRDHFDRERMAVSIVRGRGA